MNTKLLSWVGAALILVVSAGCYQSTGNGDEDAAVHDVPEVRHDADADADVHVDVNHEPPPEIIDVTSPDCLPQQAEEDPNADCYMCFPCYATPYIWRGDRCDFAPLCCLCMGADCGSLYTTFSACMEAHRSCPTAPVAPLYPEAKLAWTAPGGEAGIGPMLLMDGMGDVRFWESDRGIYDIDGPDWDRTDWNYSEDLGVQAANDFFDMLVRIDYASLPHPPTQWVECYPQLLMRTCAACEQIRMGYQSAPDLRPEFDYVYGWLDQMLCRGISPSSLPGYYCDFDF